ncbi:serine/threonine-protein kinase grp-like isoform X1 [Portunus trituberculatus]|uniref:serine/threonine-protein kinase grp-like isoform X1 n=2 Tax=Portunus trituberculatus TaxID=210409 RepID=UPI001E1CF830|nr:serine/threonine-protein kinase grp-like isoform X1 [Portunus trituberculatus]XP_045109197.1 serine/threonine-protein kinase grp-like isoform X1 [Portunus trituberculatus]
MAGGVTEFVQGWNVAQTLGEGAFGEVKLLINQETGEAVAMKIVDLAKHPDAIDAVRKEMCLHRMLKNPHIIKFYGSRRENTMQYMFLEYAAGGELFDRIEPDIGMPPHQAQTYFKELIAGVEYLHSRGVSHRDLKPENLLLDENDRLKITDFGMATLFRHQGKERNLDRQCGTKPYMAPEVLLRPYSAEPADIWSCGIVLVALLAGELPWDEPTFSCTEYTAWKDKDCRLFTTTPWTKIDNLALSLLRKVLNTVPKHRATINQIKSHQWVTKNFNKNTELMQNATSESMTPSHKRICSEVEQANSAFSVDDMSTRWTCSQPEPPSAPVLNALLDGGNLEPGVVSFSQPAKPEQLLLSSQMTQGTQASQTPLQRLVKRMTRMLVRTSLEDTVTHLEAVFNKLNYSHRCHAANVITVTTVDRRGAQLVLKASILDMAQYILLDFRLSKGCGLDFKRHFLRIKEGLSHIIVKGPVTWNMAMATNMLPA